MSKKALLVGINYEGNASELKGCIHDAMNWKAVLTGHYGFVESDIVLLTDHTPIRPTYKNIVEQLAKLVEGNKAGDSLVFCFSGHGSFVKDHSQDESDGQDETIIPLDYQTSGQIIDDFLKSQVISKIVAGAKLTVISDSCFSGTVLDLKYLMIPAEEERQFTLKLDAQAIATEGSIVCISGSRDDQTSADAFEDGSWVGALSYGMQQVMKAASYFLTHEQLLTKLRIWLTAHGYSQVPQMSFGKIEVVEHSFSFLHL